MRTRIEAGVGGVFGRLRAYTMVFCYDERERSRIQRRFETWTGHMVADDHGVYLEREIAADPNTITVQVPELSITHVDEGETPDSAELEIRFGIDDQGLEWKREGVHDGERIALDPEQYRLQVQAGLDGDLWCWGLEKDLGGSLLDRDDPLPWAVDFYRGRMVRSWRARATCCAPKAIGARCSSSATR